MEVNVWLLSFYQFYRGETEPEPPPFGKIRKEPSPTKAAVAVVAAFAAKPTDRLRGEATLDKRNGWREGGREGGHISIVRPRS